MRTIANEVREYVVLGHQLEVHLCDEDQWRVVVDGVESLARFAAPYDAWAAGAAESYRQGRLAPIAGTSASSDASCSSSGW